MESPRGATVRRLLTFAALLGAAVAIAFLFIGVGHSMIVLATGRINRDQLAIDRGRWDLVVASVALFIAFLALIPVRLKQDWRSHGIYAAFIASLRRDVWVPIDCLFPFESPWPDVL